MLIAKVVHGTPGTKQTVRFSIAEGSAIPARMAISATGDKGSSSSISSTGRYFSFALEGGGGSGGSFGINILRAICTSDIAAGQGVDFTVTLAGTQQDLVAGVAIAIVYKTP